MMETLDTEIRCAGCGVRVQTENPQEAGYVPEKALAREPLICQRCFRLKHYNEASAVAIDASEFFHVLNRVGSTDCLVLHIVDLFDFEGSLITALKRFAGDNPIVLAINKIDLLPHKVNVNKIVNWAKKQTKEYGLKVAEVVLCSAQKNIGFDQVVEALEKHRGGRDIYVVGATNVGKSTLINRLIRDYSDLNRELTTSRYPGTTLDLIKIPLDDGKFIVDTPGIVYSWRLTELVQGKDLRIITPEHTLHPRIYQLNAGQTLFFGALARLDFTQGERQPFTCYVSNSLGIHRTKLERADEIYERHKGEMLFPPSGENLQNLPPLTKQTFRIRPGERKDIAISGLGWIKVNHAAVLTVAAPRGVKVVLRDAMI